MISRKTSVLLSDLYESLFTHHPRYGGTVVSTGQLYDFLFERDYEAWFANMAKDLRGGRAVKEWVMKLHTGETLFTATPKWTWEQRQQLGQEYLRHLTEDILRQHGEWDEYSKRACGPAIGKLKSQLELDGYKWTKDRLLLSETTVIDVMEAVGLLHSLVQELSLAHADAITHFLELSEEHFIEKRWPDSIANSRKFLESVLQEIAAAHSWRKHSTELNAETYSRPVSVRDYLELRVYWRQRKRRRLQRFTDCSVTLGATRIWLIAIRHACCAICH